MSYTKFCSNCGREIPADAQFCSYCGMDLMPRPVQRPVQSGDSSLAKGLYFLAAVILIAAVVLYVGKNFQLSGRDGDTSAEGPPTTGWYKQGGRSYYYEGGEKCIGMIKIGKHYYYFDKNGALMVNTTVENDDDLKIRLDDKGRIVKLCYPKIEGNWDTETYTYGNRGESSVMEFTPAVEGVTSTVVYVQASGLHGSNIDGYWRLYFRINGQWVEQGEFSYSGTSTTVYVPLDFPTTIEAITAHPIKEGNASYSGYFELRDVWCEF